MRLFVALPFSKEVQNTLLDTIAALKKQGRGNFTRPENLHLTLAFIGETERVNAAVEALARLEAARFELKLSGSGHFGNLIWAGIGENPALRDIAAQTQHLLREAGFALESRVFKPHITLVREYVPFDGSALPKITLQPSRMTVQHLSLMKSERIGGKLTYTEIFGRELQ